jgi:hypothetical protein
VLLQKFPITEEICPNLHFLGRSGIVEIEGVSIAFLSGSANTKYPELYSEAHIDKVAFTGQYFTLSDISMLEEEVRRKKVYSQRGVDLFLSCQWPLNFERFERAEVVVPKGLLQNEANSAHVARVA